MDYEKRWEVWVREPEYKIGTYQSQESANSVREGLGGIDRAYVSQKLVRRLGGGNSPLSNL